MSVIHVFQIVQMVSNRATQHIWIYSNFLVSLVSLHLEWYYVIKSVYSQDLGFKILLYYGLQIGWDILYFTATGGKFRCVFVHCKWDWQWKNLIQYQR